MRRAIEESKEAAVDGGMPFGATLVVDGKEVLSARNRMNAISSRECGENAGDATRHAEVELVRLMCRPVTEGGISSQDRQDAILYTSTEPCAMCAGAIFWAGISHVVFGCTDLQLGTISGPGGIDLPIRDIYARASRPIKVRGPFLDEEALEVHRKSGVWGASSTNSNSSSLASAVIHDIALERSLRESSIGNAASDAYGTVPVIDMSGDDDEVIAQALWDAAHDVGFFSLTNHGIPQEVVDDAFSTSQQFFAQDVNDKEKQSPFEKRLNSGYEFMSQVRPSTGTPDQKESLQITARNGCMEDRWPTYPDTFRTNTDQLMEASHKLAQRIMSLLESKACPHLKLGTLANAHSLWGDEGQCTLRLLHYPPMDVTTLEELTTPDANNNGGGIHWRAGPHTDWDCVTLLFQREGQAGLECRANPRKDHGNAAKWIPVPPVEGGIAVNIGDMLARWSDGALFSNLHRVRMPNKEECGSSRYSIAFFAQADRTAFIESPKTEPISAGDYILSRVKSNFAK
eukprot:scaffold91995_cov54-Attheya_sp.AAC.3